MRNRVRDDSALPRLLRVKRALGLAAEEAGISAPSLRAPNSEATVCLNCGYSLAGQVVDRCPECGLILASQYRDPTPWTTVRPRILGWLQTARMIWRFERRARVRTSLAPTTPETRRFAVWSILGTMPMAGAALAVSEPSAGQSQGMVAAMFLARLLVGGVLTAAFLAVALYVSAVILTGTWCRLRFVPSSLHYATAWWPATAFVLFPLAWLSGYVSSADHQALIIAAAACGIVAWAGWLAASATESGRVPYSGWRVTGFALVFAAVGTALLAIPAWTIRVSMTRALAAAGSGLTSARTFGTLGAARISSRPRTCAIIIDAIPSDDEQLIEDRIAKLGAGAADRVVIRGKDCTLANIKDTLRVARGNLGPDDKLILYINGHGAEFGAGSIRMVDGEITGQAISDFLNDLKASQRLLIIDSCFGGKFVRYLADRDVVVLAATDSKDIAFKSGLQAFWQALGNRAYDRDGNGRITIREAFWGAYEKMLRAAEEKRAEALARVTDDKRMAQLLNDSGFATPQLEEHGKARGDEFAVDCPPERK